MGDVILEHLEQAPIDEVACGVAFDAIEGLDALVVGSYWRERSADFPGHDLRTPVRDAGQLMTVFGAVPPLRSMLISKDDQFVLQIQADRFYLNWRRRKSGYPRFNNRAGSEGVLGIAMREFSIFAKFCGETLRAVPQPKSIELAKIDVMREGVYWKDLSQVGEILPCLRDFVGPTKWGRPSVVLRFSEPKERGQVHINIALGAQQGSKVGVLTLETRLHRSLDGRTMEATFKEANDELNAVFATLIPKEQRLKYFTRAEGK